MARKGGHSIVFVFLSGWIIYDCTREFIRLSVAQPFPLFISQLLVDVSHGVQGEKKAQCALKWATPQYGPTPRKAHGLSAHWCALK